MVGDRIISIINSRLEEYFIDYKINTCMVPENGVVKYILTMEKGRFEIRYFIIDNYYRIKFELNHSTTEQNPVFLTKSKKYHKCVKKIIKTNHLPKNTFEGHMICFSIIIAELMNKGTLNSLKEYVSDLKFDGIFI